MIISGQGRSVIRADEKSRSGDHRWDELADLIQRATGWEIRRMDGETLVRLIKAYRRAAAHLARQGAYRQDRAFLQQLVPKAYSLVYAHAPTTRLRFFPSIWRFVWKTFPETVRRQGTFVLASALFLIGGIGITALMCRPGAEITQIWLGEELTELAETVAKRHHSVETVIPLFGRPLAFWVIVLNNWRVALLAFASSLLFLLPGVYILFANGKMVGAVLIFASAEGTLPSLLGFIFPHGAIELPAIILAGASGLVLCYHWISPGDLPRWTALTVGARRAVPLLIGSLLLLVYAAMIEAFVSPESSLPDTTKLGIGILHLSLLFLYFLTPRHR